MIDLAKLAEEAFSEDGDRTVVQRAWLAQVHKELEAGRTAQAKLSQIFAGKEPAPCTAAASAQ